MNMSNLSFGEEVIACCPKCGYQHQIPLSELNASGENTKLCHLCRKFFSFTIMFFGEARDEKQMENKP